MFTTGLMRLHQSGKVTNARKGEFRGFSVSTFALGTAELYTWLDGNPDVRFLPVEVVNAPDVIARNHHVVSINGALAVDLYGQVVADRLHGRQFSGIGGHEDFVGAVGAGAERSFADLPAVDGACPRGVTVSRIVATLTPGTTVTSPRHQVDVVITEHGVAELRGRTMRERGERARRDRAPRFPRRAARARPRRSRRDDPRDERAVDRPPRGDGVERVGSAHEHHRRPADRRGSRRGRSPRARARAASVRPRVDEPDGAGARDCRRGRRLRRRACRTTTCASGTTAISKG